MSAQAAEQPEDRLPAADASPAEIRAFLHTDDVAVFDRQWRDVMATATRTLDLAPVRQLVEHWRRYAVHRASMGEAAWAAMTDRARERFAAPPDVSESLSWEDLLARRAAGER